MVMEMKGWDRAAQYRAAAVDELGHGGELDLGADADDADHQVKEAMENPHQARENLTRLQKRLGEVIESLSGADKALLSGLPA